MSQNHLPPNSDFSSEYAHFTLEIWENLKIFAKIQKFSLKVAISGVRPQKFRNGGTRPPSPHGGDAHPPGDFDLWPIQRRATSAFGRFNLWPLQPLATLTSVLLKLWPLKPPAISTSDAYERALSQLLGYCWPISTQSHFSGKAPGHFDVIEFLNPND